MADFGMIFSYIFRGGKRTENSKTNIKSLEFMQVLPFVCIIPQGHSHISLLIEMGFSALAIADRVGHESIDITYRYAHLFPTKQTEMADKLDDERGMNCG